MHRDRFVGFQGNGPRSGTAAQVARAGAFVACPMALLQGGVGPSLLWQQVYQLAFEQAQAVVRPSRLERYQDALLN
jgi:hypothetical protein